MAPFLLLPAMPPASCQQLGTILHPAYAPSLCPNACVCFWCCTQIILPEVILYRSDWLYSFCVAETAEKHPFRPSTPSMPAAKAIISHQQACKQHGSNKNRQRKLSTAQIPTISHISAIITGSTPWRAPSGSSRYRAYTADIHRIDSDALNPSTLAHSLRKYCRNPKPIPHYSRFYDIIEDANSCV